MAVREPSDNGDRTKNRQSGDLSPFHVDTSDQVSITSNFNGTRSSVLK